MVGNTAATSAREETFAQRVRATAMRTGSARGCCSAAPTTASPTIPRMVACGTLKTTAANLDVHHSDLVVKERVPVCQVNTQCVKLQGTLQEKLEE